MLSFQPQPLLVVVVDDALDAYPARRADQQQGFVVLVDAKRPALQEFQCSSVVNRIGVVMRAVNAERHVGIVQMHVGESS